MADLRKLIDDIAKLESGAPDISGGGGGDNSGNWETQSVCSDVSGVGLFFKNLFFFFSFSMLILLRGTVLPAGRRLMIDVFVLPSAIYVCELWRVFRRSTTLIGETIRHHGLLQLGPLAHPGVDGLGIGISRVASCFSCMTDLVVWPLQ